MASLEAKRSNSTKPPVEELDFDSAEELNLDSDEDTPIGAAFTLAAKGAPRVTLNNTILALEIIHPKIVIHNDFSGRSLWGAKTPWCRQRNEAVEDKHIPQVRSYIEERFGFGPGVDLVYSAITCIAEKNKFNPVRDYLNSLEWDKVPRLATWLAKNFEAQGPKEYLSQLLTKFMVGLVARPLHPGFKVDSLPVLEGPQGCGKSSFGRILVGDEFFTDSLGDLSDKDSILNMQGKWLVELPELSSIFKTQIEPMKAWITRQRDRLRAPYGRLPMELPRKFGLIGTTNDPTYLKDPSGNRRFRPVQVGQLNFEALERDREQLLAEAVHLLDNWGDAEETINRLTGKADVYLNKLHAEKMILDDGHIMAELIREYAENGLPEKFKMTDLFEGGPLGSRFLPNGRNLQFAGRALHALGYEKFISGGYSFWRRKASDEPW